MTIPNVAKHVEQRHSDIVGGNGKMLQLKGLTKVEYAYSLDPLRLLLGKYPRADFPNSCARDEWMGKAFSGCSFQSLSFYPTAVYKYSFLYYHVYIKRVGKQHLQYLSSTYT